MSANGIGLSKRREIDDVHNILDRRRMELEPTAVAAGMPDRVRRLASGIRNLDASHTRIQGEGMKPLLFFIRME